MRFLIDNALSPAVASSSTRIGHDAVHVRELGMHTASDEEILDRARTEDRAVVSPGTDFGTLLATLQRPDTEIRARYREHPADDRQAHTRPSRGNPQRCGDER